MLLLYGIIDIVLMQNALSFFIFEITNLSIPSTFSHYFHDFHEKFLQVFEILYYECIIK